MLSKSINGRICYQASCPTCGKDLGFRPKSRLGMNCISCGHSIAKKGKVSPLKGKPTGRPAWNKKIKDPLQIKLRQRVSRRLRHAFKGRNIFKSFQKTFDILGYSVNDLKKHLESKFYDGMTWENIGQWHIDHVVPDSWFQYSSIEDAGFKESWKLNNLQPMWAEENIKKNNNYAGGFCATSRQS
jgi:DNA-directed RNA polymerase subunit RPC12/RpoP